MTTEEYHSAVKLVKEAEKNVKWCIESGKSTSEVRSARTKLSAADLYLDQIISTASLAEREKMLFPRRDN